MTHACLQQLQLQQQHLAQLVSKFSAADYRQQFHADLSPVGWHLGHCVFTEDYWLHEVTLNDDRYTRDQRAFYVPEHSPKDQRGAALPEMQNLLQHASRRQAENHALLSDLLDSQQEHALLANDYLPLFLAQHYAQHAETICMIHQQAALQENHQDYISPVPLEARNLDEKQLRTIGGGNFQLGSDSPHVYDNEQPSHEIRLGSFDIARVPVTNAEFLGFILDGGYTEATLWDKKGWQWQQQINCDSPLHWRQDTMGHWYQITLSGAQALEGEDPVFGLCRYEAQAFANWARARLPSEQEWEVAKKAGLLEQTGCVWEWCSNTLEPYPGFRAWPYDGYSTPYFDDHHYVLRGGSLHTQPLIKRSSFRNYFQAGKRHMFAGLRLAR